MRKFNPKKKRKKTFLDDVVAIKLGTIQEYLKERGWKDKLYGCFIKQGWEKAPATNIVIIRQKAEGWFPAGFFTVDKFCRGIVNTECHGIFKDGIAEVLKDLKNQEVPYIPCQPDLAFTLIYGSWHFAEKCGLSPHPDFEFTRFILPPEEEVQWVNIQFGGTDGRPFYMAGPLDDDHKIKMTMQTLTKHLGPDGFDYYFPFSKSEFAMKKSFEFVDQTTDNPVVRLLGMQKLMSEILPRAFAAVLGNEVPKRITPEQEEQICQEAEKQGFEQALLKGGERPGKDFFMELRQLTLGMVKVFNKRQQEEKK